MRAPILCLKNRQMRRRRAGDAVRQWKSAAAQMIGEQRDHEMSLRRRFSANCFMLRVQSAAGAPRPQVFHSHASAAREMHHFCGSAIATLERAQPFPALPGSAHSSFIFVTRQRQ